MDWHGTNNSFDAFWFLIETNIFSMILGMASPQLLSRTFIAKDEKTLARAEIVQALIVPAFVFIFFGWLWSIAIGSKRYRSCKCIHMGCNEASAAISGCNRSCWGSIAAATIHGFFSVSAGCSSFSRDIYQRYINPDVDEKKFMTVSKVCVVITAVITFALSVFQETSAAAIVYAQLFAGAA